MVIFAVIYYFAQLLAVVIFVSHEKKSERIERKFKTQNPNLGFPLRGPCLLGNPLPQAEKGPKYEGWVNSGAISESESGDSSCLVVS